MNPKWLLTLLPVAMLLAADETPGPPPAWAAKEVAQWSQDDANQVLTDSPWAKSVTPSIIRGSPNDSGPPRSRGGFGFPGGGGGFPGGGGGYPGGGGGRRGGGNRYPPQDSAPDKDSTSDSDQKTPKLTLRWESASPVRSAELKARDENAPTLEDENHYALALYGIPASMLAGDSKQIADEAKKKTTLSRDGKKDMKPTSVQVLRREDGPVVLFLFLKAKKEEITKADRRVEFDTQVKRLSVSQSFYLEDMTFQGKTAL